MLPVMLAGRVGGLGLSNNGVFRGVMKLLLSLSWPLLSSVPSGLMTCAIGCSVLRLLRLSVLVALSPLLPGLMLLILLRSLPCVRGVVSLWVTGIMSVGLVLSVLSMPPKKTLVRIPCTLWLVSPVCSPGQYWGLTSSLVVGGMPTENLVH